MEEVLAFLPIIIIAIISTIAKNVKKPTKQQSYPPSMSAASPQQVKQAPQPAPAARPASMASQLPQVKPRVAQPVVHTHLAPDCETHDAPSAGSLNVRSSEGKDPCHADQLPAYRTELSEEAAAQPALALDWSGDAMVKAFVMQEVLTRPCDRHRH